MGRWRDFARVVSASWRKEPRDPWYVYVVDESDDAVFFFDALRAEKGALLVRLVEPSEVLGKEAGKFIYIGEGDESGVWQSVGLRAGLYSFLCSGDTVREFKLRPAIWWANNSAKWARNSRHRQWIGYDGMLDTDRRGGAQTRWWRAAARKMWRALIRASEGRGDFREAKDVFVGLARDITIKNMENPHDYTLESRLKMQAIADGLRVGSDVRVEDVPVTCPPG